MLCFRSRRNRCWLPQTYLYRERRYHQRRRLDFFEWFYRRSLLGQGCHSGSLPGSWFQNHHGFGRETHSYVRKNQCWHTSWCQSSTWFRCQRCWSLPYGTHVLRRRPYRCNAWNDFVWYRWTTSYCFVQNPSDAKKWLRRNPWGHGRVWSYHPFVRPAITRIHPEWTGISKIHGWKTGYFSRSC